MIITYAGPAAGRWSWPTPIRASAAWRAATWRTLEESVAARDPPPPRPVPEPERPETAAAPAAGWRSGDGRPAAQPGAAATAPGLAQAPFLTGGVAAGSGPHRMASDVDNGSVSRSVT